jgi:hypothetical protein
MAISMNIIISDDFALKRSVKPYVGELVIISMITAGMTYTALQTSTWALLELAGACLVFVAITHLPDLRYRVFWRHGAVECVATNNQITSIKASDISNVMLEKSDQATMLAQRRPIQRIIVYSKNGQHLDVSLKHFVMSDIKRLMQEIHNQRPDLALPKI